MKELIKRDVWAFLVIPLVATIIPYGIIWLIDPPHSTKSVLWDLRLYLLLYFFASGILCRIKIFLVNFGLLSGVAVKYVNIILTIFLIYPGFVCLLLSYIPTLILLLVLNFVSFLYEKKNKKKNFLLLKVINGVVLILSYTCAFVTGMSFVICGEENYAKALENRKCFFIFFNHRSTADYVAWVIAIGEHLSKIVAGDNLKDFPVFASFLKLKAIIAKGRRKNGFYIALQKIKNQILDFFDINLSETNNSIAVKQMQDCYENGIIVGIGPNGRTRLSAPEPKPHMSAACGISDVIVPVILLDTGKYKRVMKKEPLAKPWYKFQWYVDPQVIYIIICEPMYRKNNEARDEFRDRVDEFMKEEEKIQEMLIILESMLKMRYLKNSFFKKLNFRN